MKTIRYCNECPFMKSKKADFTTTTWCFAPKFLEIGKNIALENKEYLKPPEECPLNKDSIIIQKEPKEVYITQEESNRLSKVDK